DQVTRRIKQEMSLEKVLAGTGDFQFAGRRGRLLSESVELRALAEGVLESGQQLSGLVEVTGLRLLDGLLCQMVPEDDAWIGRVHDLSAAPVMSGQCLLVAGLEVPGVEANPFDIHLKPLV